MFKYTLLLLLVLGVGYSAACDGWKVRFNKIVNCLDNNVIKIDTNFTTSINKKCEVTTNGCLTSLGFTSAKVKYVVSKNGMPVMSGEPDVCAELGKENAEAVKKLEMFGFPTSCPIPEGRRCVDPEKKVDVTKFKKYLALAKGKVEIKTDIVHDTGKTCVKIEFEVYK